jgi:hypothetical protein
MLQLADYLDIQNEDTGWLVTFGLGQMEDREPEWIEAGGKNIFSAVV